MPSKPNILWIVTDHQAYYQHSKAEGARPQTPNFDRLASQGISFDRSYAAVPLCGPARRTLLTGLFPHNHGNYYNYTDAPYDHEVYLSTLAAEGYRNFYFGKWHAGPGTALDFDCEGFSDTDYGNPYITPRYKEYLKKHGLPQAEHFVEHAFWNETFQEMFPDLKAGATYRCDKAWCGEHAVGLTLTPKETHESFFLANLACEALEELAKIPGDQPFHLRVDFWGPHQPHFPTKEFADLYNPDEITEYGSFRDTLENKPDFYFQDNNRPLADEQNRLIIPSPLPWEAWQKIVARAYAHITMVDAAAGLIVAKLDELGFAENTLVIWTADHGDALASHGGRFDKGSYMTEEVLRVPLAIRYPPEINAGQRTDKLVSSMDLPPTILAAAGTAFQEEVDGRSLLPLCYDPATLWRTDLMTETFGHGYGKHYIGRAILTERFKYVTFKGQISELYDLEKDPYELDNLIEEGEFKPVLAEMKKRLQIWQRVSHDPGFFDEKFQEAVARDGEQFAALAARRAAKTAAL
jgi:arylsulfatase A-like enzyme